MLGKSLVCPERDLELYLEDRCKGEVLEVF